MNGLKKRDGETDIVTMIVAAFLGTVSEIVCVTKGLWTYEAPILMMGIPVWLPLVWANLFNFNYDTSTGDLYITAQYSDPWGKPVDFVPGVDEISVIVGFGSCGSNEGADLEFSGLNGGNVRVTVETSGDLELSYFNSGSSVIAVAEELLNE